MKKPVDRRLFFKGCLSAASVVISNPALLASADTSIRPYARVRLIDRNDQPVTSEMLKSESCYVFNYPFVSTPCFLINTGKRTQQPQTLVTKDGESYEWQGGCGPEKSVVSFAAICAHKLSYPTKKISFINYRADLKQANTVNQENPATQQVIFCCSERSTYDPLSGAKVLSGPAPGPLTTIALEYDAANDHYYAVGTLGSELYEQFFERFGFNLALENQIEDITAPVEGVARIYDPTEYSKHLQSC